MAAQISTVYCHGLLLLHHNELGAVGRDLNRQLALYPPHIATFPEISCADGSGEAEIPEIDRERIGTFCQIEKAHADTPACE